MQTESPAIETGLGRQTSTVVRALGKSSPLLVRCHENTDLGVSFRASAGACRAVCAGRGVIHWGERRQQLGLPARGICSVGTGNRECFPAAAVTLLAYRPGIWKKAARESGQWGRPNVVSTHLRLVRSDREVFERRQALVLFLSQAEPSPPRRGRHRWHRSTLACGTFRKRAAMAT
jgi:hypothetical protein